MRVGITGGAGFLGWHTRCRLRREGIDTLVADRAVLASPDRAAEFVAASDAVIHLAGVNRASSEQEVIDGNALAADQLAAALRSNAPTPVIYANSTHSVGDSAYGRAKAAAADTLDAAQRATGSVFQNLVLPQVFGEFGRPNYNSAIHTFAHALANGLDATINREGRVELLHAQDVADHLASFVSEPVGGAVRLEGRAISIGEVWDLLTAQHERYVVSSTVPAFADRFELQLFNTLRSQLDLAGWYPRKLVMHGDDRGVFAELNRADGTGQVSVSTTQPGITRGDHWHTDKIERFIVTSGQARISLRRLFDDTIVHHDVSGDELVFIDMPPLTTHNITNTGDSVLTTIFWAGDHFDPATPDTWPEPVQPA